MARKKKQLPLLHNFEITGVAAEGNAIGKLETESGRLAVFIPYGAPGDIADVQLVRKKHSYAEGRIVDIVTPSPIRIAPRCDHYGVCGGCRWQHIPYPDQLRFKQQHVEDALQRIAKVELPETSPIIGSPDAWEYRNKMEYTFSNKKWLTFEELATGEEFSDRDCAGFHIPGAFDKVLDVERCYLQKDLGNQIRNFVKNYGKEHNLSFYDLKNNAGFLRTMMVRLSSAGESMLVMVFGEDTPDMIKEVMDAIRQKYPEITSLLYVVNTKLNDTIADLPIHLHSGREFIYERMEGLTFRIGPKSFYQTNSAGAYQLYKVVRKLADIKGNELVYDLYTGTGTIANFVSKNARKVIGIEYVEDAIKDARINSADNNIDNTLFFAGDMKDVLTEEFISEHGRPDIIITDPPRAGMHENVIKVILEAAPEKIVYVSCNPATQARDIALLDSHYQVMAVQPVDMFPHTHHVENVALLTRRQSVKEGTC
ncbi:MAG: 23S rRNA (uracil(1939)-C(5))-methyltransferase RlmD [Muribaculaceae bacterium]|nr:23S rRNA (uracil(1939)-C(5))-methyltransferase RlmD [Muribaculaceae bacterium]